jgi:redox-sensitive bicupin YhaK (pirin superfamily)
VIEVRRAADRFTTSTDWRTTRHSFSFGEHYDPGNVGFAVLLAHNDDVVSPGHGYDTHPHRDLEIVTWVLEGTLVHRDSRGAGGVLHPGVVQRLSAGSGVLHSERNDRVGDDSMGNDAGARLPTRFVQMWLRPDEAGVDPSYAQHEVGDGSGLVPLVSGIPGLDAAVGIGSTGAALQVARLAPAESVVLPDAPHLHVFVARGSVTLEGAGRLEEGDAARFTAEGGPSLTSVTPAEVLVWQLP